MTRIATSYPLIFARLLARILDNKQKAKIAEAFSEMPLSMHRAAKPDFVKWDRHAMGYFCIDVQPCSQQPGTLKVPWMNLSYQLWRKEGVAGYYTLLYSYRFICVCEHQPITRRIWKLDSIMLAIKVMMYMLRLK